MMMFSPADAVHSRDVVFRELLCSYHPLAAAAALGSRPALEGLAGRIVRDHYFPQLPEYPDGISEPARAVEAWFRERYGEAILRFVFRAGIDVKAMVHRPQPEDERCRSVCPRCLGQYEHDEGTCSTCNRPLLRFDAWPEIVPAEPAPLPPEPEPPPPPEPKKTEPPAQPKVEKPAESPVPAQPPAARQKGHKHKKQKRHRNKRR
jgi:hypothetical protein